MNQCFVEGKIPYGWNYTFQLAISREVCPRKGPLYNTFVSPVLVTRVHAEVQVVNRFGLASKQHKIRYFVCFLTKSPWGLAIRYHSTYIAKCSSLKTYCHRRSSTKWYPTIKPPITPCRAITSLPDSLALSIFAKIARLPFPSISSASTNRAAPATAPTYLLYIYRWGHTIVTISNSPPRRLVSRDNDRVVRWGCCVLRCSHRRLAR